MWQGQSWESKFRSRWGQHKPVTLVFAGPDLTRFVGCHSSTTQGCSPVAVIFWWERSRLQQFAQLVKARGVCLAFSASSNKELAS